MDERFNRVDQRFSWADESFNWVHESYRCADERFKNKDANSGGSSHSWHAQDARATVKLFHYEFLMES